MPIKQAWDRFISGQYRRPTGPVGEWIGRKMEQQHAPENQWTVDLLTIQPTDHVLELGFGPGLALREVLKHAQHTAGLDFSQTMVNKARRDHSEAVRVGRLDVRHGDVHSLPFADQSFDKVFSIHSIYFWQQPEKALREVYRVLKPGGMAFFTILPAERFNSPNPKPTPTFRAFNGAELAALFHKVGFASTRIEDDPQRRAESNYAVVGLKPPI